MIVPMKLGSYVAMYVAIGCVGAESQRNDLHEIIPTEQLYIVDSEMEYVSCQKNKNA